VVKEMQDEVLAGVFETHIPADAYVDAWDLDGFVEGILHQFGVHIPLTPERVANVSREALLEQVQTTLAQHYAAKAHVIGSDQFQAFERWVALQVIDKHWKDHLLAMDHLKEGIGLRGYGQKKSAQRIQTRGI
jgi:preprotein translocase subunit SecA